MIVAVYCNMMQECIALANMYPDSAFVEMLHARVSASANIDGCYCWVILRGNDGFVKEIKQRFGDRAK